MSDDHTVRDGWREEVYTLAPGVRLIVYPGRLDLVDQVTHEIYSQADIHISLDTLGAGVWHNAAVVEGLGVSSHQLALLRARAAADSAQAIADVYRVATRAPYEPGVTVLPSGELEVTGSVFGGESVVLSRGDYAKVREVADLYFGLLTDLEERKKSGTRKAE